jgi:catechol 2,3-dioxygenase-like lactoylglutathione lyase family enzyme
MQLSKQTLDVGLVTGDVARARTFYTEVMGLAELPDAPRSGRPEHPRVMVGGHILELAAASAETERAAGGTGQAHGMRLLAFILDDLGSVLARFDALRVPYQRLPLPAELPFEVAFASDPDGNALELVGLRRPAGDAFGERLQIGLTVSDVARTKHFYTTLLGFPEQPEMQLPSSMGVVGDVRHAVTAGATTLKFWKIGRVLPTPTGAPERRTGIRVMRAWVADVDAVHAELVGRGVEIAVPPRDLAETGRGMTIADPDGNWIELIQFRPAAA